MPFGDSMPILENLILSNNKLSDLNELVHLRNCKSLQRLSIMNNPVTSIANYRLFVIGHLPHLRFLDY